MKQMAMVGPAAVFAAALVMTACPGPGGGNGNGADGGADANDISPIDPVIKVSGTAEIHPQAKAWLTANGRTVPSIEGLTHRVEEPLKVGLGEELGVFGTTVLDSSGAYSVAEVDTANVNIGIGGGIIDERDAGLSPVVRSATSIFDVTKMASKPEVDINGARTFILPAEFEAQLTLAVTPEKIRALNRQADAGMELLTLIGAGFMFGQVVDASGAPVAGVKLSSTISDFDKRFFYPSADYTTATQSGTSANGTFVFVGKDDDTVPDPFVFRVEGRDEFQRYNGGAKPGAVVLVRVYPGAVAPP